MAEREQFRSLLAAKVHIFFGIAYVWSVKNKKWNGLSNCKFLYSMLANYKFASFLALSNIFVIPKITKNALKRPENGLSSLSRANREFTVTKPQVYPT